jgi:tetratricopeptide (TPR) repeat protein
MRSPTWLRSTSAVAVLLASAAPIVLFASPTAAVISILVTVGGIAGGLLIRALLNRSHTGRFRLIFRRPSYVVPADLPPPPGVFVGRDGELADICELLAADRPSSGGPAVVTITGGEGLGKTALAVTAAHVVAHNFSDGQILVRFDTQRSDGTTFARDYLTHALKSSSEEPPPARHFDRWYRRRTQHRRLLVVLDNVPDTMDVTRFLPAGSRCAAIITSRKPVRSLQATLPVTLGPLVEPAGTELLRALLGERADLEPRQIAKIVEGADGYPAALQMAGAVVRTRRSWDLDVAFGEAQRLTAGAETSGAPRFLGVLNLARALLTEQERRCLALLALPNTRRVDPWMLAVLAETAFPGWGGFDEVMAARVLDRLSRLRFAEIRVDEQSGVTVYRIPTYVQEYAEILLPAEVSPETADLAATRLYEASKARLERTPEEAARREVYHLLDQGRLTEALAAARENLHLCHGRTEAAEDAGEGVDEAREDEYRSELVLAEVLAELGWLDDAVTYTRSSDDVGQPSQIRALRVQGRVRWRLRQTSAAIDKLTIAHGKAQQLAPDPAERIRVLRELTIAHALSTDPKPALTYGRQALDLADGDMRRQRRRPSVLWAYGIALMMNGRLDEADTTLAKADVMSGREDLEQALWRPWIRHQRALVALEGMRFDDARSLAASALGGFTSLIHRYGSGHCRQVIGRAYLMEGDFARAVPALEEALQTFERCGDRWIEADTAHWLGLAYRKVQKHADDAAPTLRIAVAAFEALEDHASATRSRAVLKELARSRRPEPEMPGVPA